VGGLTNNRTAALVAAAVTIVLVAVVALKSGKDKPAPAPAAPNPPAPVSASELKGLSTSLRQPVYWAGPQGATKFELTRAGADRISVRYPAAPGANPAQGTLTVATYRLPDATAAVRRAGGAPTAKLYKMRNSGLAVLDNARPTNVYFAYPNEPFQVEVFDPAPGRALKLVLGGRVKPVR
jgi:hypothetical protein